MAEAVHAGAHAAMPPGAGGRERRWKRRRRRSSFWAERDLIVCVPTVLDSQDELIDAMRSEGRRQAAQRLMKQKREMTQPAAGTDEEPSGSVATVDA